MSAACSWRAVWPSYRGEFCGPCFSPDDENDTGGGGRQIFAAMRLFLPVARLPQGGTAPITPATRRTGRAADHAFRDLMNIHEHQAKSVLSEFGVAVPRGYAAFSAEEAYRAAKNLGGSVFVVKSQIHAGGRGKGRFEGLGADAKGGVRVVKSADDVRANAEEMLGRVLVTHQTGPKGKQVNRLYIEEGADIAKEFYLSLLVDRPSSMVSVVASPEGGMDIEEVAHETPEKIHTFSIDPATGVWPTHQRALAKALGLTGGLAKEADSLLTQLYTAFMAKDMAMLEINPLIVTADDHLRVLDAKVSFDGNALYRHPDIKALRDETEEDPKEIEASKHDLAYIALDG